MVKPDRYREGARLILNVSIVLAIGFFYSILMLTNFAFPTPLIESVLYSVEFAAVAIVPLYISRYIAEKIIKKDKWFSLKTYCMAYLLIAVLVSLNLTYGPLSLVGVVPYASSGGYGYQYFSEHILFTTGFAFEVMFTSLIILLSRGIGLEFSKVLNEELKNLAVPVAIVSIVVIGLVLILCIIAPPPENRITQCAVPPGFTCITTKLQKDTSKLYLRIGQGTGHSIQINGINCTQQTDTTKMTSGLYVSYKNYNAAGAIKTINMSSGSSAVLADSIGLNHVISGSPANATNIYCTTSSGEVPSDIEIGSVYNGKIYINYTELDTGTTRIVIGTYTARYEA
jgi:hypothetical protein